jgi:hypothetical protein
VDIKLEDMDVDETPKNRSKKVILPAFPGSLPESLPSGLHYRRPVSPEKDFEFFFEGFFEPRGALASSYDPFVSKVNKSKVEVVYDKQDVYNGVGDGRIFRKRIYNRIGREIQYDTGGGEQGGSVWCAPTSPLGNVYTLDIFANRDRDGTNPPATLSTEATVYWKE